MIFKNIFKDNMRRKKGKLLIYAGSFLIVASFILTAYNFYDNYKAKQSSGKALAELGKILLEEAEDNFEEDLSTAEANTENGLTVPEVVESIQIPDYITNPHKEMPIQSIDGQDYIGILGIPSCELHLPIISEWSYRRLKIAPCRYHGSVYTDDLVIAAHNYKSHFGNLQNLKEGDTVILTDMDGNVFNYQVVEKEILAPTDMQAMEEGNWDLTLFTCTVGGASRVTVRCTNTNQSLLKKE